MKFLWLLFYSHFFLFCGIKNSWSQNSMRVQIYYGFISIWDIHTEICRVSKYNGFLRRLLLLKRTKRKKMFTKDIEIFSIVRLSPSKKIYASMIALPNLTKNAFYIILKAFFVLKIFKFLS